MRAEIQFRVGVAGVPDRAALADEVWAGDDHICEVSIRDGQAFIEIYPRHDGDPRVLDYGAFVAALEEAADGIAVPPETDDLGERAEVAG